MIDATTQATQQQTTQAPAGSSATETPLPPELQYLKDHGEDISEFLPKPPEGDGGKPAEGAPADGDKGKPAEPAPKVEDEEPGEVVIGKDGRAHDPKTGRFVPLKALHDERGKRQTAESELQKLREALAAANARLEMAKPADGKKADAKKGDANPFNEPDIDPAVDFVGAAKQLNERLKWQRNQQERAAKETTAVLTEQGVTQAYRDDTSSFISKQPDYPKAFKHVVEARLRELIAMGVTDQAALTKQIREDEAEIVRQAIASRRSPAQVFYALAIAKGYKSPEPTTTPAGGQPVVQSANPAPSGTQPAAAAAATSTATTQTKTPAQQLLENVQAGQESGRTLTGAGAGAGAPGLTLEQYLNMDADQIIALKKTPQGLAQLKAIGAA